MRATKAGFMEWDADDRRHDLLRPASSEMLGYPADADTSGWRTFFSLVHPEDREAVRTPRRQLRDPQRRTRRRCMEPPEHRVRADGSYGLGAGRGDLVTGADGRTLRHVCSFIDIAEKAP